MTDTRQLLTDYTQNGSDSAFRELVTRYVDLVYSTAFRLVDGDTHRARDVAQVVFVDLAAKARDLSPEVMLGGWLHRHTCFVAAKTLRGERRRQARERQAVEMNALEQTSPDDFSRLAPVLDEIINTLDDSDRVAILLRFYEQHDFRAIGETLGTSEDAARMRVNRALDKLQQSFKNRGIETTAAALAVTIFAGAVQAAPTGLAATIGTAALAGTTSTAATLTTAKIIAMTTLQKITITAAVVALAGAGIYEARQSARLRDQVQNLQQQQAPLADEISKLRADNATLSNLVAETKEQNRLSHDQFNELIKLRGQSGQAQTAVQELAKARTALQQNNTMPAFMTNAMAQGANIALRFKKKEAAAKVARMKDALHLTDDQAQAVNDIMLGHINVDSQKLMDAMFHGQVTVPPDANDPVTQAQQIKALLTPDQLANYDAFEKSEVLLSASNSAKSEVQRMTDELSLTPDQQSQVTDLLVQNALNANSSPNKTLLASARAGGDYATIVDLQMKAQQQALDDKLKLLSGVLTPDQLQKYQQAEQQNLDMTSSALKMFLPQTNNTTALAH